MLRVAISGVAGRMGNVLVQAISVANDLELSAAFESKTSPVIGKDVGEVVGVGQLGVTVSDSPHKHIEDFDIVIDFSVPEATLALGEICREHAKPMVIGTTGFSASQLDMLGEYSGEFPIFISPNMSLGVNILFRHDSLILPGFATLISKCFPSSLSRTSQRQQRHRRRSTATAASLCV